MVSIVCGAVKVCILNSRILWFFHFCPTPASPAACACEWLDQRRVLLEEQERQRERPSRGDGGSHRAHEGVQDP